MRVWVDNETKDRIVENFRKRNEARDLERRKDPRKLHVSELVYCLRESCLRRRRPEPVTLKRLGFYLSGGAWHGMLEGLEHGQREFSIEDAKLDVELFGTIDLLGESALEIKSSRSDKSGIDIQYMRQLFYYLAIIDENTGRIFLFRTKLRYIDDPFVCMGYELTPEELICYRGEMWGRVKSLVAANVDPRKFEWCGDLEGILPMIEDELKWKCVHCFYRHRPLASW